jgi:hypothetical protein
MKRVLIAVMLAVALAAGAVAQIGSPSGSSKNKNESQLRELTGAVLTNGDRPLPNAIVYLKNTKTLAVKTFITPADGKYRFPSLQQNLDYEVYAEFNGKRSDTKTLSSFDSRPKAYINLKIDTGK